MAKTADVPIQLGLDGKQVPYVDAGRAHRLGPSMREALKHVRAATRPIATTDVPVPSPAHVLRRLEQRGLVQRYRTEYGRGYLWLHADPSERWASL